MDREYPQRPIVGVGIAVLRSGSDGPAVLLARRGRPPDAGAWSLPGGAQELGETVEAAARRELSEETGLTVGALTLVAHVDSIHRDPEGRVRWHYTLLDFTALWRGQAALPAGDVTELAWAALDRLEAFGLWSEAVRVIGLAKAALGLPAGHSDWPSSRCTIAASAPRLGS